MPDVLDVEGEVTKLRSEIDRLNKEQVVKRSEADKLRDDMIAGGFDVTKLMKGGDTESEAAVEKLDLAYRAADELAEDAKRGQALLEKMYGWTGRTAPAGDGNPVSGGGRRQRVSPGRRMREHAAYQAIRGDATNAKAQMRMGSVPVFTREEFIDQLRNRAGLDLGSGQTMVTPDLELFPPVELPVRAVKLLDLINVETTESDVVLWTRQTQRVLAAAPTPTGTNAPEATLAFARETSNVKRVPVILTAPKEVLADEGRVQGLLDRQLMTDTRLEIEVQALAGDGTGENLPGILNEAGIGNVTQGSAGHVGEYALDAIHRAITFVRLHLFEDPDGIGLHPVDLETVVLQKDSQKRYIFPPTEDQASIWGFPATSSPVFSQGTGLVGNYRLGATLWIREDVVVTATDGYTDVPSGINYFSAGLVAIMAQIRAAFATERPFAFCEVSSLATV